MATCHSSPELSALIPPPSARKRADKVSVASCSDIIFQTINKLLDSPGSGAYSMLEAILLG